MTPARIINRGHIGWQGLWRMLVLGLFALWLYPASAAAGGVRAGTATVAESVAESGEAAVPTCFTAALSGDDPSAMLRIPARYLDRLDCRDEQASRGAGNFWLRLDIGAARAALPGGTQLSFVPEWQQNARLYALHADGRITERSLDNRTLSRLTRMGGGVEVPLTDDPGHASPVVAVVIGITGAINGTGLIHAPTLRTAKAGERATVLETALYSSFAGMCIALFIYNLAIWLPVRERFQLTYCLMLLAMMGYGWTHSGAWSLTAPEGDITLRFRCSYAMLSLAAALAMRFFVDFLERRMLPQAVRWLGWLCRLWLLAAALAILVLPPWLLPIAERFYVYAFVPLPFVAITITVAAMWRGSDAARGLLLAWVAPAMMASARILHSLNIIHFDPIIEHSAILTMSVEALLSALAMALRLKRITGERDIARAEERIARRLAEIDPLTGVLNRRALLDRVLMAPDIADIGESQRLLLVDIDHFKQINDRYGHDNGDAVLRQLAVLLVHRCGGYGVVARLGGEEFALIGPASRLTSAVALAVLNDVRSYAFSGGIVVTVSIGASHTPVSAEADWLQLYRRADAALYEAKAAGRNRAVDGGDARLAEQPDGRTRAMHAIAQMTA